MIFIESDCHDPYFNLAMEQYVFDRLPREEDYFMLWPNENTIVVGKYQNTAAEVNASFVREHKIPVARRLSGGGAVYHDLGNINYTFITDAQKGSRLNFEKFCRPLVRVLQSLGVPAQVSGRNDVTIEGMKCSGSSQYIREGRIMHHGTILFDSDLDVLGKALIVPEDKIVSKGVASVRSRVTKSGRTGADPGSSGSALCPLGVERGFFSAGGADESPQDRGLREDRAFPQAAERNHCIPCFPRRLFREPGQRRACRHPAGLPPAGECPPAEAGRDGSGRIFSRH